MCMQREGVPGGGLQAISEPDMGEKCRNKLKKTPARKVGKRRFKAEMQHSLGSRFQGENCGLQRKGGM